MALANRTFEPKTRTSRVDAILARLEDNDRDWLLTQMADPDVSAVWISAQLDDEGFTCSSSSINNWRRRNKP